MVDIKVDTLKNINVNNYDRYVEIMFGAGKSLLHFRPKNNCVFNDPNTDLINFYKNLHDPELRKELKQFATNWELLEQFSIFSANELIMAFKDFNSDIITSEDLVFMIRAIIMMNMDHENFNSLFEKDFVVSIDMLSNFLIKSIEKTLIKLKGDSGQGIEEQTENINTQIKIGFKTGFYDHFKNLMNFQKTELIDCLKLNKHLATWHFLKENTKGKFLLFDKNGNIKNQLITTSLDQNLYKNEVINQCNTDFVECIKNASLSNVNSIKFINEISSNQNDLLVLNLLKENLIISSGKNTIHTINKIDLFHEITKTNNDFIVLTKDEDLLEFGRNMSPKINIIKEGSIYCIVRLK